MKKQMLFLTAVVCSTLIAGCGGKKETTVSVDSGTPKETEVQTNDNQTQTENTATEVIDSGIISHLREVANDPDANSVSDKGVTYMFSKDDNGNRTLGTVVAFYTELPVLDTSTKETFCRSYVEKVLTELVPYLDDVQISDKEGMYQFCIPTEDYLVMLTPGEDFKSMMVLVSDIVPWKNDQNSKPQSSPAISLDETYNWYVGDIWNPLTNFRDYIETGKSNTGGAFDADFAYDEYTKALENKEKYTDYIHENHPDIVNAWDKMMGQIDEINKNLADGYEPGSEPIELDLLSQYSEAFYEYVNSQKQ